MYISTELYAHPSLFPALTLRSRMNEIEAQNVDSTHVDGKVQEVTGLENTGDLRNFPSARPIGSHRDR